MSKKHFIALAARIAREVEKMKAQGFDPGRNPEAFLHVKKAAEIMADVSMEANDRFDYHRFMVACNLPDLDEERALANLRDKIAAMA